MLTGAALFVRRSDFEAVGGFDPAIFLYHEDDDLSRRLRAERGPIMFIRGAEVRHLSGHSTSRNPQTAAFKAWHMGRSRVYASRKHGRLLPFTSATVSALIQLLSPVTWSSRRTSPGTLSAKTPRLFNCRRPSASVGACRVFCFARDECDFASLSARFVCEGEAFS